jgi:hypothetical protein
MVRGSFSSLFAFSRFAFATLATPSCRVQSNRHRLILFAPFVNQLPYVRRNGLLALAAF